MISTFRNLFVRIKWDGSLSKCLVHSYYYTTLFSRLCFEMKSAPRWDVTVNPIKKESSQLVGKDLGPSIQYSRDLAASALNGEGTSKGNFQYKGLMKRAMCIEKKHSGIPTSTLTCPLHHGELETRKNIKPSSYAVSQTAIPSPVLLSMHPSIQPFIHLLLSIQLFVYLSISSVYPSIYSTSCKEIQYRCSILQTTRCKSKPMVSKYLEISCEKNQIKPYFQDCVLNFTRERAWNAKWA